MVGMPMLAYLLTAHVKLAKLLFEIIKGKINQLFEYNTLFNVIQDPI